MSEETDRLNRIKKSFTNAFYFALAHAMYDQAGESFTEAMLELEIYKEEIKRKAR